MNETFDIHDFRRQLQKRIDARIVRLNEEREAEAERARHYDTRPCWETINGGLLSEQSCRALANMSIPEEIDGRKLNHLERCWLAYGQNPALGEPPPLRMPVLHAMRTYDPCDRAEDMYWGQGHDRGWALKEALTNGGVHV